MASLMAIENAVFGSCGGEIDVSDVVKCGDAWLRCEQKYLRFILASKAAQYLRLMWEMVPGIEGYLWWSGSDLRNKKPLWWQGLEGIEKLPVRRIRLQHTVTAHTAEVENV